MVAWRNGAPIRLDEVANVLDSVEDDKKRPGCTAGTARRAPSHSWSIRQPGSNTIEVIDEIKKLLPAFKRSCRPR